MALGGITTAPAGDPGTGFSIYGPPVTFTAGQVIPLGLALRFFHYALFNGDLLSLHYFITDTLVLVAATSLGYRLTQVSKMVRQYPWLYERTGPFNWRSKAAS